MMRTVALIFLFALSSVLSATPVVTLEFIGPLTGINDGVAYVSPYKFAVDSEPDLLVCVDPDHTIRRGDTWQASVLSYTDLAEQARQQFRIVFWLVEDILANPNSPNVVPDQHAIWWLQGTNYPADPAAEDQYQWALGQAQASVRSYSEFRVYKGIGMGQDQVGMVGAPEPGIHLLCGAGLLLIGSRRKWLERFSRRAAD
jgi:hypothetical protein